MSGWCGERRETSSTPFPIISTDAQLSEIKSVLCLSGVVISEVNQVHSVRRFIRVENRKK